jgi:glycine/D-amino acid oxidase-like deaminating enzyme
MEHGGLGQAADRIPQAAGFCLRTFKTSSGPGRGVRIGGAHFYISQSDKGGMVFGGDLDWYKSCAQRGNLPIVQDVSEAAMSILPCLGRVKLLRHWSGLVDMSMDGTHFICKTPLTNLYLNAGWNYGGFKALRRQGGTLPT